ncbi:DUF6575 domain-containing protein [Serratia sp. D1N4]
MKKLFTHSPIHGDLYYKSIYDYFDGPKLFSVITKRGEFLLVYWIDESDTSYSWVSFPISKSKLLAFESKSIDIFNILEKKDEKLFFLIETPFKKGKQPVFTSKLGNIKDFILMPDTNIYISFVENVITNDEIAELAETGCLNADYSIHIDKPKSSKSMIDFSMISPVFVIIDELYKEFISIMNFHDKLIPVSGKPGSFTLDFNSKGFNLVEEKLTFLSTLMKNRKDITRFIKENNIPSQSFEKLLNHVIKDDLIVDFSNKNTENNFLKINKLDAEYYVKKINSITSMNVNSKQVPQADTLDKIFEVVENIWRNGFLERDSLDLSDRHILYYTEASKILGFVSESGRVTSIGQQVVLSPLNKKMAIAAQSFENSHCGWTWITWSNVTNITQLNPNSSKAYLDECAPTLSESTKERRARTLKNWCTNLKKSYRELG